MRSLVALAVIAAPPQLEAQAELQGRVLAEPERRPIANATITVPALDIRTVTDSLGRFRLTKISRGEHFVVTRALGFRPDSAPAAFDGDETVVSDIVLEPAVNELLTVTVRAAARPPRQGKMAAFDARKALGVYVDGTVVYSSSSEQVPLFDVNGMQADPHLAARRTARYEALGNVVGKRRCKGPPGKLPEGPRCLFPIPDSLVFPKPARGETSLRQRRAEVARE